VKNQVGSAVLAALVGLILMLGAMTIYVVSDDLTLRPRGQPRQPASDAVGKLAARQAQKDSKYHVLTELPTPYIYFPYRQRHGGEFWIAFFTRTVEPARAFIPAIHHETAAINPNAGVTEVSEYSEVVSGSLYAQKVAALLLSVLGSVSLLLAALGTYALLA
jgi:hypothetical protein